MHGHWLKGYLRDGKEIEGSGGGGSGGEGALSFFPMTITASGREIIYTAQVTAAEIMAAGPAVFVADSPATEITSYYYLVYKGPEEGVYYFTLFGANGSLELTCESPDAYPSVTR